METVGANTTLAEGANFSSTPEYAIQWSPLLEEGQPLDPAEVLELMEAHRQDYPDIPEGMLGWQDLIQRHERECDAEAARLHNGSKNAINQRKYQGPQAIVDAKKVISDYFGQLAQYVTTSGALDIVYAARKLIDNGKIQGFFATLMLSAYAVGVRNRLRQVYADFVYQAENLIRGGKTEINVLSLACGSAEATVIGLTYLIRKYPEVRFRMTLVDIGEDSLERAKKLAIHLGVAKYLALEQEYVHRYVSRDGSAILAADIVEFVGFLDYVPEEKYIGLLALIHCRMKTQGVFLTSNILAIDEAEHWLLRIIIGWPGLIHLSFEEFSQRCLEAGFSIVSAVTEPQKAFANVILKKDV